MYSAGIRKGKMGVVVSWIDVRRRRKRGGGEKKLLPSVGGTTHDFLIHFPEKPS